MKWFVFFTIVLALAAVTWVEALPQATGLRDAQPDTTALMRERVREARAEGRPYHIRRIPVPLSRISPDLRRAVIVAEDARFYHHHGIDWQALAIELHYRPETFSLASARDREAALHAFEYYLAHRNEVRGRSTITQQLAKNLYFGTRRSLLRKVKELVVARRLEHNLTKNRILELYLNDVEWGPGIFGAEAAARAYFGKPAADLDTDEAAALAATLPHPLTSNPALHPGRMAWREAMILHWMRPDTAADSIAIDSVLATMSTPPVLAVPGSDSVRLDAAPPAASRMALDTLLPDSLPAPRDTTPVG